MRSTITTAADVPAGRSFVSRRLSTTTGLERELVQSRAMCRRHEMTIEALTRAVWVLRNGATALAEENRELRAEVAGVHRGLRA